MTTYRHGKGWAYRFRFKGREYYQSGFGTRREAQEAEDRQRASLTELSLETVAKERLARVRNRTSRKHVIDIARLHKRILVHLGGPLSWVTPAKVVEFHNLMAETFSKGVANRCLKELRALFRVAVDLGWSGQNPTRGIRLFPVQKRAKVVPGVEEVEEALLQFPALERAYLTTIWLTAARVGEINSLTWEDVDFEEGVIRLWTRKTGSGDRLFRRVPMVSRVRQALEYAWRHRVKGSPWVFTNPDMVAKYPDDPQKWKYQYRSKLLRKFPFRYHNLRHSAATLLARLGVELTAIQAILGHARPTTTDIYLSTLPIGVVEGMQKLDKLVGEGNRVVKEVSQSSHSRT